jgi:hypothetical protein
MSVMKNTLAAVFLLTCFVVNADYMCVENDTNRTIVFRLSNGHYDVFLYSFIPEEGGLVKRDSLKNGEEIKLSPAKRLMFRTMYSYEKSGASSELVLVNGKGSIVFANDPLEDFKLSDTYDVSVLFQSDVLDDDFLGMADRVYKITKSNSAPSSPKEGLKNSLAGRKRSVSDLSSSGKTDN